MAILTRMYFPLRLLTTLSHSYNDEDDLQYIKRDRLYIHHLVKLRLPAPRSNSTYDVPTSLPTGREKQVSLSARTGLFRKLRNKGKGHKTKVLNQCNAQLSLNHEVIAGQTNQLPDL